MRSFQSLPLYSVSPFPDFYMTPHLQEAHDASLRSKVTVVGGGNWGSVAAKLIASNTLRFTSFHDEVRMWVFEETLPRVKKLTDVINETNENVKYLPGIKLGKNVIADPDLENAGFVDGLEMGNNTKAAIMRLDLEEIKAFSKLLFPSIKDSIFFESCGVADLITTCLGERNREVAEAFARSGGKRSFEELEKEMLQGQKLQAMFTRF